MARPSSLTLTARMALIALAVTGAPPPASAQTPSGADLLEEASPKVVGVPFAVGEHLRYKVKYGIFSVGEAHMTIAGIDTIHGMPTYVAEWRLKGSVLGYGIDETFTSWIDTEGLFARRFVKDQGERYREYEFFPAEHRVQRIDHDTTWALPDPEPLDDISIVYFTRTLDLDVGRSYTFDRFYNDEGNPIVLNVLRKDRREVGAGEFNTVVVRPIIQTDGLFSEGGDAEIHFSDDEHRMVVYMKVDGPFLPLNLTLHLEEIVHVEPGGPQTPDDVPDSG
ncbi:MAG: DUF3108 domain-containing protein [Gemmatimonadetes bacterium]|nr:DUF3108 domain-containing protein [Gemmatimonadota bacterium]